MLLPQTLPPFRLTKFGTPENTGDSFCSCIKQLLMAFCLKDARRLVAFISEVRCRGLVTPCLFSRDGGAKCAAR